MGVLPNDQSHVLCCVLARTSRTATPTACGSDTLPSCLSSVGYDSSWMLESLLHSRVHPQGFVFPHVANIMAEAEPIIFSVSGRALTSMPSQP